MNRQQRIHDRISEALHPFHLDVAEETHMHNVPADAESHYRVLVVSETFEGLKPVERQRAVNRLLADEFQSGLHALALVTWTPEQWFEKGGQPPESPPCLGGSKAQ